MPYVSNGSTWNYLGSTGLANGAALWGVLSTGPVPALTLHADAGTGATYTISGNRLGARLAVTTGSSPVSGGTLATLALTGYTYAPFSLASARDDVSAVTFPYVNTTPTSLTLKVAGEIEPGTTYSYDIIIQGA